MKKVIFAGTYDPFTLGHYDVARRAAKIFDEVIIGVASDAGKNTCASLDERLEIARYSVADLKNVCVKPLKGFLVDFAAAEGAEYLIRGIRSVTDFEYEKGLRGVYKSQNSKIECVYLISDACHAHISGSVVRQLLQLGGSISGYVCESANDLIKRIYNGRC